MAPPPILSLVRLLASLALFGACATAARPARPISAKAELIREAFTRPKLHFCDEQSVCFYYPPRYYSVRAVRCMPVEGEPWDDFPVVACSYERQRLSGHWRPEVAPDGEPGKPPRARGPWRRARTSFIVYGDDAWSVHDDPYRGRK